MGEEWKDFFERVQKNRAHSLQRGVIKKKEMPEASSKFGKKASSDLGRLTAQSSINNALDGIQRIGRDPSDEYKPLKLKAIIHKMVLTMDRKTYEHNFLYMSTFFKGCYLDKSFVPSDMPNYKKKYIKQQPNFLIDIFTDSINHRPPLRIEIIPRKTVDSRLYKELLISLNGLLTGLKVSSVEYTIDQYCHSHRAVQNLFSEETRYLYRPFKRNAQISGANFADWGGDNRMNSVYRISDTKVYERGNDDKKQGGHWEKKDLNRVRLEYTAPRELLLKHGINRLKDFIEHPKFYEINKNKYKFKCFEGSEKLPRLWEAYSAKDKKDNDGLFQLEIIRYRKEVKNVSQYIRDVDEFDKLKSRIVGVMKEFDKEWKDITS